MEEFGYRDMRVAEGFKRVKLPDLVGSNRWVICPASVRRDLAQQFAYVFEYQQREQHILHVCPNGGNPIHNADGRMAEFKTYSEAHKALVENSSASPFAN